MICTPCSLKTSRMLAWGRLIISIPCAAVVTAARPAASRRRNALMIDSREAARG